MSRGQLVLEPREPASGLLDEPLLAQARGADGAPLRWRARLRDDGGFVWRASGASRAALASGWSAVTAAGEHAALRSLRPVAIEVRVEAADGRAASRTLRRALLAAGARVRRWRAPVRATLHLPARATARTALVLDPAGDAAAAERAALAAPLLASRGVVVLALEGGQRAARASRGGRSAFELAREQLARVPAAAAAEDVVAVDPPLPPGIPVRDEEPDVHAARAAAWDALLARLGAAPRAAR